MTVIQPVPDLFTYPDIVESNFKEKLVVFVGAGVSALWGCKRWEEMAAALIDACKINYWEKQRLKAKYSGSPRRLITICRDILGPHYFPAIESALIPKRRESLPELFNNLRALNSIFLTTNIDTHLSSLIDGKDVFVNPEAFPTASQLKVNTLIHLHGSICHKDHLVLTVDEYIQRYQKERFKDFMGSLFKDEQYRFLFVGYGLEEMEILDFLVERFKDSHDSLAALRGRAYVLLPYFQNERELLKYEEAYFKRLSMDVIPYAIDDIGYPQLDNIFLEWRKIFDKRRKGEVFYQYGDLIEKNL